MLKLESYLTGFSSKSDGSAGIRFATQELSGEEFSQLKNYLNQFGWLVFSPNPIDLSDLPKEQAEEKDKTPSKRLRAVLYVLYKQKTRNTDFEAFYRDTMNKIIDLYKSKLDDK